MSDQALTKDERASKLAAIREAQEVKHLMYSPSGRRFVWRMLTSYGIYATTFNTDAGTMAFMEGRRSAGIELMTLVLNHTPEKWFLMHQENASQPETNGEEQP